MFKTMLIRPKIQQKKTWLMLQQPGITPSSPSDRPAITEGNKHRLNLQQDRGAEKRLGQIQAQQRQVKPLWWECKANPNNSAVLQADTPRVWLPSADPVSQVPSVTHSLQDYYDPKQY